MLPRTINAADEKRLFETKQQDIAAVKALQASGVRSVDVGCLQKNLMHHPAAFATLADAFDLRVNAAYAGRFLNGLYAGGKDWARAIAAYHSEMPTVGDAYRALVMAHWQNGSLRAALAGRSAYGVFSLREGVYADFGLSGRVYGAFAVPERGRR